MQRQPGAMILSGKCRVERLLGDGASVYIDLAARIPYPAPTIISNSRTGANSTGR